MSNCPRTHPYLCKDKTSCTNSLWEPGTSAGGDCNGERMRESSYCCPNETSQVKKKLANILYLLYYTFLLYDSIGQKVAQNLFTGQLRRDSPMERALFGR